MAHEWITSLYILRCITKDSISLVCSDSPIPVTSSSSNLDLCNTKVHLLGWFCSRVFSLVCLLVDLFLPIAESVPIITHLCFSFPQIKGSTFTENHPSTNSMVKPAFLCVAFKSRYPLNSLLSVLSKASLLLLLRIKLGCPVYYAFMVP